MTINERVKEVRMHEGMTMERFGECIGVQRSAVSKIEKGMVGVSEQVIKLICKEFHVSEMWLRSGDGDMIVPEQDDFLGMLVKEYDLDPLRARFMRSFLELDTDEMQSVLKFMKACVGDVAAEEAAYAKRFQNATDATPSASSTTDGTEAM